MRRKSRTGLRKARRRGRRVGVGVGVHIIASTWVEMARLTISERGIAMRGGLCGATIRRIGGKAQLQRFWLVE